MRFRLALALSISVLLIGVSSWYRFSTVKGTQPSIVAVSQLGTSNDNYEDTLSNFTTPKTGTTSPQEPLSNTDLIGRQLILDYVGLAANGQATDENINILAGQYADKIPNLHKAGGLEYKELSVIPDSQTGFKKYADEFSIIYTNHVIRINVAQSKINGLETFDNTYRSFAGAATTIYADTASALRNLPVPTSLATVHLRLINNYLSDVEAMKSVSGAEDDPIVAFAGIIAISKNLDEETVILTEIEQIAKKNGI